MKTFNSNCNTSPANLCFQASADLCSEEVEVILKTIIEFIQDNIKKQKR